ncbi:MAG: hypothetical protein KDE58_24885, partial [Caldilineaceae bacterium]|nr:hypothetical protein [Caldilineaceae bacterium]
QDEDDEDDDTGKADFEEYDVDGERVYAHAFITADGDKIAVKELELDEEALVTNVPLRDGPGREVAISEATGNEGATKDLWYHRGAVILWPKEHELALVASMDTAYGIHVLKQTLAGQPDLDEAARQPLIQLAYHLLDSPLFYAQTDLIAELLKLGDIDLLKKFLLRRANGWSFDVDSVALIEVAETFGWHHFANDIQSLLTAQGGMQWLDTLLQTGKSISDEGRGVITQWVASRWEQSLTAATRPLRAPAKPTTAPEQRRHVHELQRFNDQMRNQQAELIYLIRLTAGLDMADIAQQAIARLAEHTDKQFLITTYGRAVVEARLDLEQLAHDPAIVQRFVDAVRQRLQAEFPTPPEPPQDWSRTGQLACDCEFCTQVNEFLPKPNVASIGIYRTLKRNLLH